MSKGDGGPAFPMGNQHPGMRLRDYFAIHAAVGILAKGMNDGTQWDHSHYEQVAFLSYQLANAMIAEREK